MYLLITHNSRYYLPNCIQKTLRLLKNMSVNFLKNYSLYNIIGHE